MKFKLFALFATFIFTCLSADTYLENCSSLPVPQTDFEKLSAILTRYGNNPEGIPTLHYAILQNDKPAIDLLLKHGASPFTENFKHRNCLYYAIIAGSLELVQRFIQLGVDPNGTSDDDDEGLRPLAVAIKFHQNEIIDFLINIGTQTTYENSSGYKTNLITVACYAGNYEAFKTLFEKDMYTEEESAMFAVSASNVNSKGQHVKILEYLNNQGLINAQQVMPEPNMSPEALVYLIDNKIIDLNYLYPTVLHCVVLSGFEVAKILLEKGVDPNSLDLQQRTPLFDLVRLDLRSEKELVMIKERIQALLKHGADINIKDVSGKTTLHYAKNEELRTFLINCGAK